MDPSIKELVEIGKQLFEARNYPRAEQYLLKVIRQDKRFADVFNMLGVIYHAEEKFSDAIDCFENALSINPNYTEAILNLAVLYNDLGKYKEAKALYTRIHQRKKKEADIDPVMKGKISNLHAQLADTYRGIGRYKEAIEEYKAALALNPHFTDIKTKLGVVCRENGELNRSLEELKKSVALAPHYLQARVQLGVTLYSMKKIKEAAREWESVLKKDPKNTMARMYLKLSGMDQKKKTTSKI
ncbi:MAG: tetratricopeptide repeat protein [bacterium]|nr:tetratricopeptide repeat protein [bacterium]